MARLYTTGFELGSLTMEFSSVTGSSAALDPFVKRTGGRSLKMVAGSGNAFVNQVFATALGSHTYYIRAYLRISAALSTAGNIFGLLSSSSIGVFITMNTDRTLKLIDNTSSGSAQIGSSSSALSLDTWYRVELSYNPSTKAVSARIDGAEFASGTAASGLTTLTTLQWLLPSARIGTYYFDDSAINDDSGSYQNSWPGAGSVIMLKPNGDYQSGWSRSTGTSNYYLVSATPPDDTKYVYAPSAGISDFYNCEDSGLGASDVIKVLHVGCRVGGSGSHPHSIKAQIRKTSAGTVYQSAQMDPGSTFVTNPTGTVDAYPITLYVDPDGTAWTYSTVDSTQIGEVTVSAGSQQTRVSAIWILVEYASGNFIHLTASASAESSTPDIAVQAARALIASAGAVSSTPDNVAVQVARRLIASITAISSTPNLQVSMDGLVHLVASVIAISSTPDISVTMKRDLIAAALAESSTPGLDAFLTRHLTASALAASSTPDDIAMVLSIMAEIINPRVRIVTEPRTISIITPLTRCRILTPVTAIEPKGGNL